MLQNNAIKKAKQEYNNMEFANAIRRMADKPSLFLSQCYDQLALITTDKSKRETYQVRAMEIAKELLSIKPQSVQLLTQMGHIYHHLAIDDSRFNKSAMQYYKKAYFLSRNKSQKLDSINNIGNSYQRMGKLNLALKYYSQGNNLANSNDISILYNLSFIYLKLQKWEECISASNQYLTLSRRLPNNKMQRMFRNTIQKNITIANHTLTNTIDE